MNFHIQSNKTPHEANFEPCRLRMIARLCVALICLVQFLSRIVSIPVIMKASGSSKYLALVLFSFTPIMTAIVIIEFLLFKKKGPRILRYSQAVDLVLYLLFTGEWIMGLAIAFTHLPKTEPPEVSVMVLYGFTSFAWRSLLATLIVHKWQLKIIAPIAAISLTTGYAIHLDPKNTAAYLIRGATSLFNIAFVIYCEDKIKWKMIWANIQQEKWMQVNNFILNNIPENIMILDIAGETKFISDYCKSFIENLSLETGDIFNRIQNLKQQDEPNPNHSRQIEILTTHNGLITETNNPTKIEVLTDIITNFQNIIAENVLQEKQFLLYNGKLKSQEEERSIEIKISFIHHFESEYIILIFRDMTQRDLLVTLEETNKYKDQLLASVSHELRTPLNGNINLVESAVNSPKIPENIKQSLLIPALRSSQFLLHMINDILDMSQIKEKKLRLTFESGDLKETLQSTAQLVELQAKKKGIKLLLELDSNLPKKFCTDHIRLSQIILNLLNNAIKFTKEGTVKLTAISLENSHCIKISVQDSGIGMTAENVKNLFSNYTHIEFEGRQSMNPAGVGLGLNIAYKLVQLLAPKNRQILNVKSTLNQGSTFSFILENKEKDFIPFKDTEDSSCIIIAEELSQGLKPILNTKLQAIKGKSEVEPLLESSSCLCPQILIVDDNPFNTMAFETILSSLEVKSDSVYSGSSAIEILLQRENKKCCKDCRQYSVMFIDQEMPEMNGIETVKEIRRLQEGKLLSKDMKIIGCTAHHSKEEVEKFVESGLDKCIHKPISLQIIQDIL